MIDFLNEAYTGVATEVRAVYPLVNMSGEYTRRPAKFPALTLDEISNVMVDYLEDSSNEEKFAGVTYRLQVFSNKKNEKKAEARAIFTVADAKMRSMGFRRVTYSTTPELYEASVYTITATYEGVISASGRVYKR